MDSATTSKSARSGKVSLLTWFVVVCIVIAVLVVSISIYGQVSGEEFSPQKFSMRRFSYVQIPLLRIQVWPIKFSKLNDDLAQHIRKNTRQNKWMTRVRNSPVRWDIMTMQAAAGSQHRGDATILTNYLKQPGAMGLESWLDWSTANPKLASELWSFVAVLANEDLYAIIPDVLESARRIDASDFKTQIRQIVVNECKTFAEAYQKAGEPGRAKQIMSVVEQIEADA